MTSPIGRMTSTVQEYNASRGDQDSPAQPAVLRAVDHLEKAIMAHVELLGQLCDRIAVIRRIEPDPASKSGELVEAKLTAPLAADIGRAVRELQEQTSLVQRVLRELEV